PARPQGLYENNAPPDPDLGVIAGMFPQANDIFQPRKSVQSSLHRASIAPGAKNRTLARNVRSLCIHPPVTPKCTTHITRRRWPPLFPNLHESRQYLSQTRLAGRVPIPARSKSWLDSVQTRALRRVRLPRQPPLRQRRPHRETDAPAALSFAPPPRRTDVEMHLHNRRPRSATPHP